MVVWDGTVHSIQDKHIVRFITFARKKVIIFICIGLFVCIFVSLSVSNKTFEKGRSNMIPRKLGNSRDVTDHKMDIWIFLGLVGLVVELGFDSNITEKIYE